MLMPHHRMGNTMTLEKSRAGTAKSAERRSARRQLRECIKQGQVEVPSILESQDEHVQTMRVEYLLLSVPRIGKKTAAKILDQLGYDAKKRISGLGSRQKETLLEAISVYQ